METSWSLSPHTPPRGCWPSDRRTEWTNHTSEEIVEEVTTETVDLAPLNARMEEHTAELREVRNQIANIISRRSGSRTAHDPASLRSLPSSKWSLTIQWQNRALADVIGTSPGNASGLIRDAWNTELIGQLNALRPLFSAAGTVQFPVERVRDRLPEDHHPHPGGEEDR